MSPSPARKMPPFAFLVVTFLLVMASDSRAQLSNQSAGPNLNVASNEMQTRMELSNMDALGDKEEIAAFQTFSKEQTPNRKIRLGNAFLEKYPKSPLVERVDAGMMNAYRTQQNWKDTYLFADQALALQPDDVDVLATVAWTIPHVYSPDDPDADQELKKSEEYAKHALEVLAKMHKPSDMSDAQFVASKTRKSFQLHSALGLVDFRREDYANSANELQLATKGNAAPDPTDLYVLGVDLENLKRYSEATEAFRGCSQIAGALQDQCKQNADSTKALAALPKNN